MKHTGMLALTGAIALTLVPDALAGTRKPADAPLVITTPAVQNGSNWSRAPFPAARPQNDITPPDGRAFEEDLPPNTPATTPMPDAPPPPALAILQPDTDPGLLPTGRPTVAVSASLDAPNMEPALRNAAFESRDTVLDSVRTRLRQADRALDDLRRSEREMSAEGRTQFANLRGELDAREDAVQRSLRAARRASAAEWESARAQLAADYAAYASTMARLDAAAGITPAR